MSRFKCLAAVLLMLPVLPNIATSPDAAREDHKKGISGLAKQKNDAITAFSETIRLDPTNAKAYNSRGMAYDDIGKHDKAITDYRGDPARPKIRRGLR